MLRAEVCRVWFEVNGNEIIVGGLRLFTSRSRMFTRGSTESDRFHFYRGRERAEFVSTQTIGSLHHSDPYRKGKVCSVAVFHDWLGLVVPDPNGAG